MGADFIRARQAYYPAALANVYLLFLFGLHLAGWRILRIRSRQVWIRIYRARSKIDEVNARMKKFNLRGVLDGLRSSVSAPPKLDIDIEENLRSEHFQVAKVGGLSLDCHRIVSSCRRQSCITMKGPNMNRFRFLHIMHTVV